MGMKVRGKGGAQEVGNCIVLLQKAELLDKEKELILLKITTGKICVKKTLLLCTSCQEWYWFEWKLLRNDR